MGLESEPGLKYKAEDEKMQKAFEDDARDVAKGAGDKADVFDIPEAMAEANPVDDGFLQKVVAGKANEANEAVKAQEAEESAEKADGLLADLGVEKGPVNRGKPVGAQQATAEKAPEVAETADVAQGEIAEDQKEIAQRSGALLKEGEDSAES